MVTAGLFHADLIILFGCTNSIERSRLYHEADQNSFSPISLVGNFVLLLILLSLKLKFSKKTSVS